MNQGSPVAPLMDGAAIDRALSRMASEIVERNRGSGMFDTLDVLTTNYKGAQSHWVQRTTRRVMWNPSGTSRLDGWGSSSAESSRVTRGSNAIR